jgi:hypothetical protein
VRQNGTDERFTGSGMRELYEYNAKLWKMERRVEKSSDWSGEREDGVYIKES